MPLAQERWEARTRDGRSFMAWSGVQTMTTLLSTANQRFYFQNPANSNTNIFTIFIATDSLASTMAIADVYLNPTTFASATTITPTNMQIGNTGTSVANIKVDVSGTATSGGTKIAGLGVPPATKTLHTEARFMIPPGNAVGVNIAFTGLSINAQLGQILVFWFEENISSATV